MSEQEMSDVEWAVVEGLATGYRESADRERLAAALVSPHVRAGEVLNQAIRHRLLTRLAIVATTDEERILPRRMDEHLRFTLASQRHWVGLLRAEVARLSGALRACGIKHAVTKGMAIESTVYGGDGGREMSDIDLTIRPEHRTAVRSLLGELGYEVANYDWVAGALRPNREADAMARLHPDHLPHYIRLSGDSIRPSLSLDFANSMTWAGSEWDISVEWCLERVEEQELPGIGTTIPVFDPNVQFLHTIMHLFREAWFERTILADKDDLAKFSDVHHMWRAWRDQLVRGDFAEIVRKYGVERPVSWVLVHAERTLGTDAASTLGLAAEASEAWLSSATAVGGGALTWRGSMRDRLRSQSRRSLFSHADAATDWRNEPVAAG